MDHSTFKPSEDLTREFLCYTQNWLRDLTTRNNADNIVSAGLRSSLSLHEYEKG